MNNDTIVIHICGPAGSGRTTFYDTALRVLISQAKTPADCADASAPTTPPFDPSVTSFSKPVTDLTIRLDQKLHRVRFVDVQGSTLLQCVPSVVSTPPKIHAFLITFDACSTKSFDEAQAMQLVCKQYCEMQHASGTDTHPCSTVISLIENTRACAPRASAIRIIESDSVFETAVYKRGDLKSDSDVLRIINELLKIIGRQVHAAIKTRADVSGDVLSIGIGRYSFPVRMRRHTREPPTYSQVECDADNVMDAMNLFG